MSELSLLILGVVVVNVLFWAWVAREMHRHKEPIPPRTQEAEL